MLSNSAYKGGVRRRPGDDNVPSTTLLSPFLSSSPFLSTLLIYEARMIPMLLQKFGIAPWVSMLLLIALALYRSWRSQQEVAAGPTYVTYSGSPTVAPPPPPPPSPLTRIYAFFYPESKRPK